MGDVPAPPIARKAIYAPVGQDQVAMTAPRSEKECPLATASPCRAQIAFDLAGPRVVLRSKHSALWAVAGSGVDLQANRHPRPLHLAPAGLELKLFYKNPYSLETQRGSRCRRQWGTTSPKGVDPARRSRGQGDQQGPRRGGPWAVRRSRSKRPLLVTMTAPRRP